MDTKEEILKKKDMRDKVVENIDAMIISEIEESEWKKLNEVLESLDLENGSMNHNN